MNPGDHLGHYEIVAPLGAGGMGEVYVARDTKLDRRIALKLLPEDLALDSERRERFEREAKAVAALNHANIVTIHSVEEAEASSGVSGGHVAGATVHFLTMELVEGETLSKIIPADGLSLDRFFDIATPLADALSAAHQKGIAHRDLKPANVMVTSEGAVKLLDFGLAKLFEEPGDGGAADMATAQATVAGGAGAAGDAGDLTEEGKVLGTVAYMSPEQAEGKPTDHRSDVFSLGIIFYEMVTGQRPFGGDTKLSVMSSIVKDEPVSVIDVNANLPRHLGRIIKRALEKDVNRCFQTALDLRNELEDLHGEIESGEVLTTGATVPVMGAGARKGSRALPIAIGALVVAAIAIAWMILGQGPAGSEGPGLRVTTHGIAVSSGFEYSPTIAPDGQWIVFATIPEGPPPEGFPPGIQGAPDLFLQNIDGQTRINLTNTPLTMEVFPQYSPDGSQIVYVRDGPDGSGIYVMGATGENPRLLTRGNANPAWAPDGTKIYVAERGFQDPRSVSGASDIRVIDVGSGEETMLFGNNGWTAMQPSASPNGERVAFWALSPAGGQRDLYTIPAGGGDPVALTNDRALDWSPLWSPDGKHLYFSSDRGGSMNIWRVAVDEATGEALGEPEPLTSGGLGDQGLLSISADGSRLVYMDSLLRSHAMRAGFDADSLTVADDGVQLSGPVRVTNLHPSPDGQRLAYVSFGSRQDLWVVNIDGTDERQLTDDIDKDWNPRWLNDNETLIFRSDRGGAYDVWRMRSDGSGRTKIVVTEETEMNLAPSPDGRYVTATQRDVDYTPLFEIGDDPQSPGVTRLPSIPETGGFLIPSDWSPDGNWLAGSWEGIVLYHRETGEYRRLTDRGAEPRFTPDGTRIMYSIPIGPFFEWWIIDLETLEQRQITVPDPTVNDLWLLPDGEHVVYQMTREPEFNVWMLEIAEGAGR